MQKLLAEEWKKVRDTAVDDKAAGQKMGNASQSLYDRLQEQKRQQMEEAMEEAKACINLIISTHS